MRQRRTFAFVPALLALAGAAKGQVCFEGPQTLRTGSHPAEVVSADFNLDGAMDLATLNYTSSNAPGSVSVRLNLGQGAFSSQATYVVGFGPSSLDTADFDGDGFPDLAVANTWSGNVAVLRNLGNGTFAPQVVYGPYAYPQALVCADFNLDGFVDIAFVNTWAGSAHVILLFNTGTGTFGQAQQYDSGGTAWNVEAADLDGNGSPDVVVTNRYSGTISVLLNSGAGAFPTHVEYPAGVEPWQVRAVDLDGDGDTDLALASSGTGTNGSYSIFFNNGAGTFTQQLVPTNDYTLGLAAADLDSDGDFDLVLANENYGANLWLLENQGSGVFTLMGAVGGGVGTSGVTAVDLDGDGAVDLAVPRWPWEAVSLLRNCSAGPTSFCFGDGSSGPCPCNNRGASGRGCQNAAGTGGALLSASGQSSLASDTLLLHTAGEVGSATSIFLQGSATTAPANFGDGLRCVAVHIRRLYSCTASFGATTAPPPGAQSFSARSAALGDPIGVGSPRFYQVYYRDPAPGFCPSPQGSTWNTTPAVRVDWHT